MLDTIELQREEMLRSREEYKATRNHIEQLDEALAQQRAELVTVHGLLDENAKLRQAIQQEESAKAKGAAEAELAEERRKLEDARSQLKESVIEEIQEVLTKHQHTENQLRSDLAHLTSQMEFIRLENAGLREYHDELENKLADAEVAVETLETEKALYKAQAEQLQQTLADLDICHTKSTEEKTYQVFATLMDAFAQEQCQAEVKFTGIQQLFQQSVRDLMFLTEEVCHNNHCIQLLKISPPYF